MSKKPHCVCSHNSLVIDTSLKHLSNEMPSPPLPPRTLKPNISPTKNKWEKFPDNSNCNNNKLQCSCNRPHSCPADDNSPPIPPKCNIQSKNKSRSHANKRLDDRIIDEQKRKLENKLETHRSSRKSGRHNSSDGDKARKKSRSKSRHLAQDERLQCVRPTEEEKYFMKNHDNLIDRNCQLFYKTNIELIESNLSSKLCQITENKDTNVKMCSKPTEVARNCVSQPIQPPDLIPNCSNSTKIIDTTAVEPMSNSQKSGSKSRMKKFFGFLMKSKKNTDCNRATTVTPDATKSIMKTPDISARPRRSKSLHIISSLSPTTSSMHANNNVISPEVKTKSTSIFAVISPTTARLKRNLLCISQKAATTTSVQKKQAATLPMANNSKSILSDNSQQRPGLTSLSAVRLSPVHLLASNSIKDPCFVDNSCNTNHYNVSHFNCANSGDICRGFKQRLDMQENSNVNELDSVNKPSSGFKVHNHSHQETSQRKTPQSSNSITRQQFLVNNSGNPTCLCYHQYRPPNEPANTCSCNNAAYHHHVCPSQSLVPSCRCMHNIVQLNPNNYHCCNNNHNVWCLVPCCSEQRSTKDRFLCSCQMYHQSASPPANFPRHVPPPSPPPPVPSFSNNHQFSRRYRQSYSKTPPPSFHTHQMPRFEDHCYEEYNLNHMPDSHQKMIISHQLNSNTYHHHHQPQPQQQHHSNCCSAFQKKPCCRCSHSKCSACGSMFYDEFGSQGAHYNINELRNNHCSSTPMSDSVFEQSLLPKTRMFASPINMDDWFNCRCSYNHTPQRHSETYGRHSSEIRPHSCRNSTHKSSSQPYGGVDKERSSSKRRKNSSHSNHGSNLDPESEDKYDISRTHHNSPATGNMLPTTSTHLSPDINVITNMTCDSTMSNTNNIHNNNNNLSNINNTISNMIPPSNATSQNDRKQHHFEPWRKTFHDNMMALRSLGWYWGPLNHLEAENLVQGRPDGTFLVRDSGNEAYFLSLTFRVLGTTYHTRIEYSQGKFSFWSQPESHSAITIVEFIDKAVAHSVSGKFHYFLQTNTPGQPPMEVSLLYPLSRYQIVQSLQHLSRFVILSNIRRDHVSHLELPQSMKGYLMEKQYYIDCIETFVKITKDSEPLTYEPSGQCYKITVTETCN